MARRALRERSDNWLSMDECVPGTSKNTGSAREVADSRGSGRCGEHLCGNFQALQEVREGHAMSGSNMPQRIAVNSSNTEVKTR